jgi:hypothetical protein
MKEYPILKRLLPGVVAKEIHEGPNYPSHDGEESMPSYRIWFRGQSRKMGDLTRDELLCALLDAQNDLELIAKKNPIDVHFERILDSFPGLADNRSFHRLLEILANIDIVAWRHRTSRDDEGLNRVAPVPLAPSESSEPSAYVQLSRGNDWMKDYLCIVPIPEGHTTADFARGIPALPDGTMVDVQLPDGKRVMMPIKNHTTRGTYGDMGHTYPYESTVPGLEFPAEVGNSWVPLDHPGLLVRRDQPWVR